MSAKHNDVKSLILVDLDKFNSLTEKSKKLNSLQNQQITEMDECLNKKDTTKQLDEEEKKVDEKMREHKTFSELENTLYAGGQKMQESTNTEDFTNTNEKNDDANKITFNNWYKVL